MSDQRYELVIAPTAQRQLAEQLPESVAFAAYEFIVGPLLDNPHRGGKQLRPALSDRHSARRGTYRVLYRIDDIDNRVIIVGVILAAYLRAPMPIDSLKLGSPPWPPSSRAPRSPS